MDLSLCIEAFKYYKPFISVDDIYLYDMYLYGKYGETLLMAIAEDGNSNILPIAFAMMEVGDKRSVVIFLD